MHNLAICYTETGESKDLFEAEKLWERLTEQTARRDFACEAMMRLAEVTDGKAEMWLTRAVETAERVLKQGIEDEVDKQRMLTSLRRAR